MEFESIGQTQPTRSKERWKKTANVRKIEGENGVNNNPTNDK